MIEIKDLLSRFSDILFSEEWRREAVRKIISEIIRTEIDSKDIKIKNNVIYLNIKPIYKNEILLKKNEILSRFQESFGKKTPKDML